MARSANSKSPIDSEVEALSKSRIYRDYQKAFGEASGLPLSVRAPASPEAPLHSNHENPFCLLMASTNPACTECLAMQRRLEQEARLECKTLKCFAGMCETAAPVRVGDKLIAFLQTGHVLLEKPSQRKFNRIASAILEWGTSVDLKRFQDAYFHTRILSPKQYDAFVKLLAVFAEHLSLCSNDLLLQSQGTDPTAVEVARTFIVENQEHDLPLARVAAAVNLSAGYFSELFKKSTGLTFVDYVTRVRVERAKNLLANPHLRISDIAFRVGFRSLSQFNRAFKRIAGRSPQQFRTAAKAS